MLLLKKENQDLMIIPGFLKSNNKDFDMSYVIDKETLKAYPKDRNVMLLGISYLEAKIHNGQLSLENAKLLSKLGFYYKLTGNYNKSLENQNKAIEIFKYLENKKGLFVSKIRLAQAYEYKSDYVQSNKIFNDLLSEFNENKSDLEIYEDFLYQHIGKNYFSQKDYENAFIFFNKALLIRKEKNDSELIESTNLAIRVIERINKK